MKKIILIFFILIPCLVISQYNRKYKNPPNVTNGIVMTIGGVSLTTMGFLVRPLYYSDPNYLGSDEFSTYDAVTQTTEDETITTDTGAIVNNYYRDYYEADDYYDYSYSSRIRRFHRPMYYSNPWVKKPWYKQNHKWPAITVGVTFTITGLITIIAKR